MKSKAGMKTAVYRPEVVMKTKLARDRVNFCLKKRRASKHRPSYYNFEERYRLGRIVGDGSSGQVRLLTDKFTHHQYACKVMEKIKVDIDEIWTEINIMKSLSSPHIVSFIAAFEDAECVYLVMELCSGGDLYHRIVDRGSLSEREAARIFTSLVHAVTHCHEHRVVHRDLKPENILFHGSHLKLADFGLSTYFPPPGDMLHQDVGSAYYIAPEVLLRSYDSRADIWSLGVILYTMLSGEAPFDGDTEEETFEKVKVGHLDFTANPCWEDISFRAQDLITRMLRIEPGDRLTLEEVMQHPWIINNS